MKTSRWLLAAALVATGGAAAYGLARFPQQQESPRAKVERITDADDDLLPVRPSRQDGDGLLDPYPKKGGNGARDGASGHTREQTLADKAGRHPSPGIGGRYQFDLVVGYQGLVPGQGMVQSYYLLDSKRGHIGQDRGALQSLVGGAFSGEGGTLDFQVMTNTGDIYSYLTSREVGRIATAQRSGEGAIGSDFAAYAAGDWFESQFRPTGKVREIGTNLAGKPYRSTEYVGIEPETGKQMRLWLADPDFDVGFYTASHMGLGVVALPKANVQKLVTRMEGQGAVFELSYVMRKPQSFNGGGYRDVSVLMPGVGPARGMPGM